MIMNSFAIIITIFIKANMNFINKNKNIIRHCKTRKQTISTYKEKQSVASSHQFTSVQKYLGSAPVSNTPNRTAQPLHKPPSSFNPNRTKSGLSKGINEHFLFLRKQNHLNTCYNIRKNKLQQLTKANKDFYQRLNSQKSLYSNDEMNKSYQSIKQIKDRLSQSKMSQRSNLSRSSSRSSLKSSNSARGKPFPKNKRPPQPMKVRAMDINKVDRREIDKFKGLFLKGNTNSKQTIENQEDIVKHNSYKKNGTYIRSMKVSGRRSINSTKETKEERGIRSEEGGLLHRIVQDLKQNRQVSVKKAR